jgi:hypothetical protein
MNVEIGTEAAQFPEKEYINGIFLAVYISAAVGIARSSQLWQMAWSTLFPSFCRCYKRCIAEN